MWIGKSSLLTFPSALADDTDRPPLTDGSPTEELALLRARREPEFQALATIRVMTDPPSDPASVVTEIVRALRESDPA